MPQTVHDVKVSRVRKYGCARVENVPPEEFGITRRQRSVMLRDCEYCFHETKRSQADLIKDGYDEEQVKSLPTYSGSDESESIARDTVDESSDTGDASINKANRLILVTEHYVLMDYEGKGKPRRYRIMTGGGQSEILRRKGKPAIEPDMVRFAAMTPFIQPHRFFGRSAADLVMDIQRIKTALLRSLLDNVYMANNQRIEVSEQHATKDTLDDLLANRPGGVVRTRQPGGLLPVPNQPIGSFAFPMVEYMDSTREWRTGVTRQGQGLDPNALQNIGERAVLDAQNAARAKTKLIARIFAETGIKELFWLLHRTVRENASEAETVKLRNKWVPVDPREWQERDDLNINVGLGSGSREQELGMLEHILQIQGEAIKTPQTKLAKPDNIYNTLKQIVRKSGLHSIEPYFTDPSRTPDVPKEPSPDEKKMMAEQQLKQQQMQADQQMAQQKLQAEMATKQADMQMQQQRAAQEAELQRQDAAQKLMLEREKMQMEIELKRDQLAAELALKRQQLEAELALKEHLSIMGMQVKASMPQNGSGGVSDVRPGGEPG